MPDGKQPYEKPEVKLIDLGNLMDEAVGIIQSSARRVETLKKRVEDITADVEDICAAHSQAAIDLERAEGIMAKVQVVLEAQKNADQ